MSVNAALKQQKERLFILSIERKTYMETTCYPATATKTFITVSVERKVRLIGVEIRQPIVKI